MAFVLGRWTVEPSFNRLTRDECTVPLEPKVMQLLLCLARRPGVVVPRRHILEEVWGNVHVVDGVLARAVYQLRKALQADGQPFPELKTVRKTGYCLSVPLRPVDVDNKSGPGWKVAVRSPRL